MLNKTKIALAIAATAAFTTNSYGQSSVVEEVLVTATKRVESVQDVAVSVSALSGNQLDNLGLSDLTDITQQIPNFQVNAWSPQLTIFNLRGVSQNNFVDNLEAPIAVYQDEAYIASINAVSGQLFDVERVEVLRGPQGTLFGRNATGGLVHYISRGASDEELNGYISTDFASYDRVAIEGAIGGAFSENVRGRFAFKKEEADGYIEADTSIPEVDDRAIGGADGFALRGILEVDFSDTLQGSFIAKYSEDDDVPTGGYVFENCAFDQSSFCPTDVSGRAITLPGVVSGDVRLHQNDTRGFLNREVTNLTAKFTKDLGEIELVSITNYQNIVKEYLEDGDAFPVPIVVFGQDADIDQFSQEFRLSGNSDKLQWQVGAFYMDYQFDGEAFTAGAPNIGLSFELFGAGLISAPTVFDANPFDGVSRRTTDLNVENFSVFGQVDYSISDDTTLIAGLRYSDDTKTLDWNARFSSDQAAEFVYAATESNANFGSATILNGFTDDEINYDDWAIRLTLQHQFNEATQGFISYNRGIKGGNWTLASAVTVDRFTHDEEVLNSFEVGFKSDISESLRINATAYYYDYKDYQSFVAVPPGSTDPNPQVGNSDATAFGAEAEVYWSPTENLGVLLGFAVSDTEVESVDAGNAPILNAELPSAPSVSANYLFRYDLPVGDSGNVSFQFDGAYYGDQFLEVTNGPGSFQEAYNVSNISVGYSFGAYDISIFTKNVFDEDYKLYSLDLGTLGATSFYAVDRTSGISLKASF